MEISKHHVGQYCKLLFLTVLLGNYVHGVLQQSTLFIPSFDYSLSIKENSKATFPNISALSVTECTLQCFSQPFCQYFTYKDGFCQIYHVWKDNVTAKKDPNENFYFSLDDDMTWHRMYFVSAGSKISLMYTYKTKKQSNCYFQKCYQKLCPRFFRNALIDTWGTLPILEVKLVLQKNGKDVVTLRFNGTGSNKINWFSKSRVLDSPWTDFGIGTKHFSINAGRCGRFCISHKNGNNCKTFEGWLFVITNKRMECGRNKNNYYPYIIYSNKSTKTDWKKVLWKQLLVMVAALFGRLLQFAVIQLLLLTGTFKKGSPVRIKVEAPEDIQQLVTKDMVVDHNHDVNEIAFEHLPRLRTPSPEQENQVAIKLSLHANNKLLQDQLIQDRGKMILLKDIHNVSTANKPTDDMKTLLEQMEKVPGAIVEFLLEGNTITGIFLQTEEMRKSFQYFPEVLLIDATYKFNDIRMSLFVLMAIDGNGESEIVALWLVQHEDHPTLEKMLKLFKKNNLDWESVQVVMADKHMLERDVIIHEMPGIRLLICLFHTLRTFRRAVTSEKMGITPAQRDASLEMLGNLAHASSEGHYEELYIIFKDSAPNQVLDYFNKEWHPIRHQWVEGLKNKAFNMLTNNRIETVNQKLNSVINKDSGIIQFFTDLIKAVKSMSLEKDRRALSVSQKVPSQQFAMDSPEEKYSSLLTPYAFKYVKQQLKKANNVTIVESDGLFHVISSGGTLHPTADSCSCGFVTAMSLPCKHIFAIRKQSSIPLFDATMCRKRWTKTFYQLSHRVYPESQHCEQTHINTAEMPHRMCSIQTQQQKYRKALEVTNNLSSLLSEVPTREFDAVLASVSVITDILARGGRFTVSEVHIEQSDTQATNCGSASNTHFLNSGSASNTHSLNSGSASNTHSLNSGSASNTHSLNSGSASNTHSLNSGSASNTHSLNSGSASNTHSLNSGSASNTHSLNSGSASNTQATNCGSASNTQALNSDGNGCPGVLPPMTKKRGRPKRAQLTVIGPPRKMSKQGTAFINKHPREKNKIILCWLVGEDTAKRVLRDGCLVEEQDVEVEPEKIPSSILDENVDVFGIKKHFSSDAWRLVQTVIKQKNANPQYMCPVCGHDVDNDDSNLLACDCCLNWYHLACLGRKTQPKARYWICCTCARVIPG